MLDVEEQLSRYGAALEHDLVPAADLPVVGIHRHRRRRPTRRALVAAAAAAAAVAVGAAVASNGTSGAPGGGEARSVHVHLADFSVDTNTAGAVTVTLNRTQILDPDALRQALAQAGVPAKITIGSACYTPAADRPPSSQALAFLHPGPDGSSTIVLTPSKLPPGSTLAIGYVHNSTSDGVHFSILIAGAPVICNDNPPEGNQKPVLKPGGPVAVG